GTLSVANASALGSAPASTTIETAGTLLVADGLTVSEPLALSGTGAAINVASSGTATLDAVISGSGALSKTGGGTLVLAGANTYSGKTTVSAGTLSINADARLGTAPTPTAVADQLTFNGGTLAVTADFTLAATRGITVGNSDGTINVATGVTLTYGGVIAGASSSADLTKSGTGVLLLSGASTYTGATLVTEGTLRLSNDPAGSLSASSPMTVSSGATFDVNLTASQSTSIGSIQGAGRISIGAGTLTASGSTDLTFSGTISGTGGLTKSGSGTLTLSGANTFSGKTTITQGAVAITADNNLGTAPGSAVADQVTLNGGTLLINETFDVSNAFASTRGITLGSSDGTISVASGKTFNYGGVVAGGAGADLTK
ncbi:MAG: autotransporter-associated beta strand repeat-containing protein, partial [Actinomycetota bacterium]